MLASVGSVQPFQGSQRNCRYLLPMLENTKIKHVGPYTTYTLDSMPGKGAGHSKLEFHLNLWRFCWRAIHCSWVKISQQRNTTEDTLGVIQVSRRISGQLHSKSWPRPCLQQIILANSGVTETIDSLQVFCAAGWKHGWRRCQLFLSMYVKLSVSLHTSLPTGTLQTVQEEYFKPSQTSSVNQGATRDLISQRTYGENCEGQIIWSVFEVVRVTDNTPGNHRKIKR